MVWDYFMREYNFALLLMGILCNTIISIVAIATSLINTVELFLLIWFVPTIAFLIWSGIIYHKSN